MDKNLHINSDPMSFFAPVIAAQLLNCFYSLLLLKKLEWEKIDQKIFDQMMKEILINWGNVWADISGVLAKRQ